MHMYIHTFASQSNPMSAIASNMTTTPNPITRISFSALPVNEAPLDYMVEAEREREGGGGGGDRK